MRESEDQLDGVVHHGVQVVAEPAREPLLGQLAHGGGEDRRADRGRDGVERSFAYPLSPATLQIRSESASRRLLECRFAGDQASAMPFVSGSATVQTRLTSTTAAIMIPIAGAPHVASSGAAMIVGTAPPTNPARFSDSPAPL